MFCIMGDCNKEYCHHCFPVKTCDEHKFCKKNGICKEFPPDVLVTGCAGFIGSHTCEKLLKEGLYIVGIDNMNTYYDVKLKQKNLKTLKKFSNFLFFEEDVTTTTIIDRMKPKKIIHLAALAGVRSSLERPKDYIDTNIKGFVNILEQARKYEIENLIYASSSSVYGSNKKVPFAESDTLDNCCSPYAVSKLCMEIYAKMYHQEYNVNSVGLRFFTVYGPRGRPDMAPYKFIKAIMNNKYITKYGDGTSMRDYTYIDDIVDGIINSLNIEDNRFCKIYNLGNSYPISLNQFINICEKVVGKKAIIQQIDNQLGDVSMTYADITKANYEIDYFPKTKIEDGIRKTFEYMKN